MDFDACIARLTAKDAKDAYAFAPYEYKDKTTGFDKETDFSVL